MNFSQFKTAMAVLTVICFASGVSAQTTPTQPCLISGSALAQCGSAWEGIFFNANRMPDPGLSYMAGYFEGYVGAILNSEQQKTWCHKGTVSLDALYAVTAKFVREHPEKWERKPLEIVKEALGLAYPCYKSK